MKINFFKSIYDLILINPEGVSFLRISKEKRRIKILETETVEGEIYKQEIFYPQNLDKALEFIIKKYKTQILGVVLNLPSLIFHKAVLQNSALTPEGTYNYLRVSLPLPLERYTYAFEKDKVKISGGFANVNFYLVSKEIITKVLEILEKNQAIPLFITPSTSAYFLYLLDETIINFDEEYIVFFFENKSALAILVKNLKIEKIVWEEIIEANILTTFSRFYDFLKLSLSSYGKVIVFSSTPLQKPETTHTLLIQEKDPRSILIEGCFLLYESVLNDRSVIDFMPIKTHSTYFIYKLPSVFTLLSVFVLILNVIFFPFYLSLNSKFKKEKINIEKEINQIQSTSNNLETQIQNLISLKEKLPPENIKNFNLLQELANLKNIELVSFSSSMPLNFTLKTNPQNLEKIKYEISQRYPQAKFIKEEAISDKEIRVYYSF